MTTTTPTATTTTRTARPPHVAPAPGDPPSTVDSRLFADDPAAYFGRSRAAMHAIPPDRLAELQLAALADRFGRLRDRVPVLTAMADEQRITAIDTLDDAAPLLLPHTVYKSYPVSLLTGGRFDALTRWLSRLTTLDLSGVDTSGCDTIDGWLQLLDDHTPLRPAHSSGTSGTMSFFPHTYRQWDQLYEIVGLDLLPGEPADGPPEGLDVIWPSFRTGRSGIARHATAMAERIAGSPERFHTLHPGLLSADVMFLAGRLRAAAATGAAGRVEISPAMAARRAEFEDALAATGTGMAGYVRRLAETLRGRRVVSLSTWDVYSGLATAGLELGLTGLFAPDSVIFPGGGSKAGALPADWEDRVRRFAGVPALRFVYAMVEVVALNQLCPYQGYHLEPWVVLYVLDPATGRPLPRHGQQTGRAAFYDLTADVHWGGTVSGDRITADWRPCACGRRTPRVLPGITRFTGDQSDDKITCAASQEALDEALTFLTGALA